MQQNTEGQTLHRTNAHALGKLGQQHAAFPLPEGDVSLSFPAELSVASAQMMASFVNLLLKQAEQQARIRETVKSKITDRKSNAADDKYVEHHEFGDHQK